MKNLVEKSSIYKNKKEDGDRVPELSRTVTALTEYDFEKVEPVPYRPFLTQGHYSMGESLLYPSYTEIGSCFTIP